MKIVPKWKKPKNPGSCQVEFEQTLLKLLGHLCVFVSEFQTQSITQTSLLHCGQSIGNYSLDATGSRPSLKESYDSICSSFISGGWVQTVALYTLYDRCLFESTIPLCLHSGHGCLETRECCLCA